MNYIFIIHIKIHCMDHGIFFFLELDSYCMLSNEKLLRTSELLWKLFFCKCNGLKQSALLVCLLASSLSRLSGEWVWCIVLVCRAGCVRGSSWIWGILGDVLTWVLDYTTYITQILPDCVAWQNKQISPVTLSETSSPLINREAMTHAYLLYISSLTTTVSTLLICVDMHKKSSS